MLHCCCPTFHLCWALPSTPFRTRTSATVLQCLRCPETHTTYIPLESSPPSLTLVEYEDDPWLGVASPEITPPRFWNPPRLMGLLEPALEECDEEAEADEEEEADWVMSLRARPWRGEG